MSAVPRSIFLSGAGFRREPDYAFYFEMVVGKDGALVIIAAFMARPRIPGRVGRNALGVGAAAASPAHRGGGARWPVPM